MRMRHFGTEIEKGLFWVGYGEGWEVTKLLAWERLATEHYVIFGVAANTGLIALAAQAVDPSARVDAVELLLWIAGRLRENVALNGFLITVHTAAVSDRYGRAKIRLMKSEHEYSARGCKWIFARSLLEVDRLNTAAQAGGDKAGVDRLLEQPEQRIAGDPRLGGI